MFKPDHVAGTVTTTAGSRHFTTTDAALESYAVRAGDIVVIKGLFMIIDEVTGQNSGLFAEECPAGAVVTGYPLRVRFHQDGSSLTAYTMQILNLLKGGAFFRYDAMGDLPGRAAYNDRLEGFAYLDVTTDPMTLYIKASDASGDWAGPSAFMQGTGGWTPVLAVVTDNQREVLQVIDWTGGTGTKPASGQYLGASGLVSSVAAAKNVRGSAGAGTGDMLKSMYDPTNVQGDAFDRTKHHGKITPGDVDGLAAVATSGAYVDLTGRPPITVSAFLGSTFLAGEMLLRQVFPHAITIPVAASGSWATAGVGSTNNVALSLRKNGVQFGTVTFNQSSNGAISVASATVFGVGDVLTVVAPATKDPSLADVSLALVGHL